MNTFGIVAISVLAAIFCLLSLAAIAALVYVYLRVRRQLESFTLTVEQVSVKLDSQTARIEGLVGTINGRKLEEAAQEFITQIPKQAALVNRIEQAVVLFAQLVKHITGESEISGSAIERARASGLEPDSYAPNPTGERFVSRSRVAEGDAAAQAEEYADDAQSFGDRQSDPE
jgi:hypothetical protein